MIHDYTQYLRGRFADKSLPLPVMPHYQCIGVKSDTDPAGKRITVPYWSADIPVGSVDQPVRAVRRGVIAVGNTADDGFGNQVPPNTVVLVSRNAHTHLTVVYEPVVDIVHPPTTPDGQGGVVPTPVEAGDVIAKATANTVLRISVAMTSPADSWDFTVQLSRESHYTLFPPDLLWSRDPEYRYG